jgi:hypothetical protein
MLTFCITQVPKSKKIVNPASFVNRAAPKAFRAV